MFEDGSECGHLRLDGKRVCTQTAGRPKVLGDGEITKKLTVKAVKFTKTAKEKIEAAGGKAEVI